MSKHSHSTVSPPMTVSSRRGDNLREQPALKRLQAVGKAAGVRVWGDLPMLVFDFACELALSAREAEAAMLIAAGFSTKEASQVLQLSCKTVDTYVLRAAKKCGKRTRTELAATILQFIHQVPSSLVAVTGRSKPKPTPTE